MEFQIALKNPGKLFRPVAVLLDGVLDGLVRDKLICDAERDRACDGMSTVLPDIMRWSFIADSDRNLAAIRFRVEDGGAARELLRQAAIEAVRLKA